jgi:hypothetical protein
VGQWAAARARSKQSEIQTKQAQKSPHTADRSELQFVLCHQHHRDAFLKYFADCFVREKTSGNDTSYLQQEHVVIKYYLIV